MGKGKEKDFGVKVLGRAELGALLLVRKVAGLQQRKGRCGASRGGLWVWWWEAGAEHGG